MDKYDGPGLHTLREHLKELRAERDSLRNQRDQEQAWRERLQESELREHHKLLAAEARVEALEPVLEAAEAFIEARWLGSREALEKSVRAALAAALPERAKCEICGADGDHGGDCARPEQEDERA